MSDAERILSELGQIVAELSQITGLSSHWSGVIKLVEGADFKGQKPFQCDILLNANLTNEDLRWRTLLHEALHSFSQGYHRDDFESFWGWEEDVVEKLQRLLRPAALSSLAVTMSEAVLRDLEEQQFYINLLGTPIRDCPASIYSLSRSLTGQVRTDFLRCFSRANFTLKGEMRWNLQPPNRSGENGSSAMS